MKNTWLSYAAALTLVIALIAPGPINSFSTGLFKHMQGSLFLASVTPLSSTQQIDPASVKNALLSKNIYFGTLLTPSDIYNNAPRPINFANTIAGYFDAYTVTVFYNDVEKTQGVINLSSSDKVADYAVAHGGKIRIHNLVWHEHLPSWLTSGTFTSDQLSDILKNHIQTIVSHYKDRYPSGTEIAIDVVNEVTCNDLSNTRDCNPDGTRKDIWSVIHKDGSTDDTDYIALAFEWAHEADPNAILYYNEYDLENNSAKNAAALALVTKLKNEGVPISGIGFQSHISYINTVVSQSTLESTMNQYASLGLQVQITEFDAQLKDGTAGNSYTALPLNDDNLNLQASVYKEYLSACLDVSACNAFVMWGAYDLTSWTNTSYLLPNSTAYAGPFYADILDDNLEQKPAFISMATILGITTPTTPVTAPVVITPPSDTGILSGGSPAPIVIQEPQDSDSTASSVTPVVVISSVAPQPVDTNASIWSFIPFISKTAPKAPTIVNPISIQNTSLIGGGKKSYDIVKAVYSLNGVIVHTTTGASDLWNIDTTTLQDGTYTLSTVLYYADGTTDGASSTFLVDNTPNFLQKIATYIKGIVAKL